jgi:hypothetical protein
VGQARAEEVEALDVVADLLAGRRVQTMARVLSWTS